MECLNPRCGKWTAQEVLFTHPIACITHHLRIKHNLNIVTQHGQSAIHLEIVRLIFVVPSARRLFWHMQIGETSLDQICGLNLDQGDLNAEFFERRNR
jgi:hypothetical protein